MVRVRINVREFGQILASDQVVEALTNHAEHMLSEAERLAPVESDDYRGSLAIEQERWRRGAAQYAIVRVVAHDAKSIWIESRLGVLKRAMRGLSRSNSRDRRRQQAADRRYDRQVAAEEAGEDS